MAFLNTLKTIAIKYGPQIMFGVGLGAKTAEVVVAAYQSTKLEKVLDECRARIESVPVGENGEPDKKELCKAYRQNVFAITKLYSVAAGLGIAGDACLLGSFGIINSRLVKTAAVASSLQVALQEVEEQAQHAMITDKKTDYSVETIEVTNEDGTKEEQELVKTDRPVNVPFSIKLNRYNWSQYSDIPSENIERITRNINVHANNILTSRYGSKNLSGVPAYITGNEIANGFEDFVNTSKEGDMLAVFYDEHATDIHPIKYEIRAYGIDGDESWEGREARDLEYQIIFHNMRPIYGA